MFAKVLSCFLIVLKLVSGSSPNCRATGSFKGQATVDKWCEDHCPLGICPANLCKCIEHGFCRAVGPWEGQAAMNRWCVQNCARGYCPPSHCKCGEPGTTEKPTTPSFVCKAVGPWKGNKAIENWCVQNCPRGNCPASHCKCIGLKTAPAPTTSYTAELSTQATERIHKNSTHTEKPTTLSFVCRAVGLWKKLKSIEKWCVLNCPRGYCPASHCKCIGLKTAPSPTTSYIAEHSTQSTERIHDKSTQSTLSPQTIEYEP